MLGGDMVPWEVDAVVTTSTWFVAMDVVKTFTVGDANLSGGTVAIWNQTIQSLSISFLQIRWISDN